MSMLCFADMDRPFWGDVYDGMDTMVEKVKHSIQKHEKDPTQCEALSNQLETIILYRWEKMSTSLHLTYALSPRYYSKDILAMQDRVAPYVDEEVANGCYKDFARLFLDDEMHKKVGLEFGLFGSGEKLSPFAIKDQNDVNMEAITWCYLYGQPFKNLQALVVKIFSQVASSFAVERNWSTYSFIHSVSVTGSKKLKTWFTFIPTCVFCHVRRITTSKGQPSFGM